MKEHYDVIEAALVLLDTLDEGIDQTKNLLKQRNRQNAFLMLQDTVEGIVSVEDALKPVLSDLNKTEMIEAYSEAMWKGINDVIADYETKKGYKALKVMEQSLEPAFKDWSNGIKDLLGPRFEVLKKIVEKHGKGERRMF